MGSGVQVTSKVKSQKKLELINQPLGEKFKEIAVGMDIIQSKLKPIQIAEGKMLKSIKNSQMRSKTLLKKKLN